MYEGLLAVHFLGLSIGAGTGFYMAALGAQAARSGDREHIRAVMLGPGAAVSNVGLVGLSLLLVSGLLMVAAMEDVSHLGWAFWAKMALVAAIAVFVAMMKTLARRARQGSDLQALRKMKQRGPIGLVLAVSTIVLAVLAFH